MRVRICKEVEIDTEVSVDIEDIQSAIAEAMAFAKDNPRSFSVIQFVSACWQCLSSLTDEQIELVKPATCGCIAAGLRDLAERFERHAVTFSPGPPPSHPPFPIPPEGMYGDISVTPAVSVETAASKPVASEPAPVKWKAVWQQKPHDSHSRMIHEFTASDDRDQAMDVAHLEIQRDYCCVTFTIHTLERLT